MEEKNEAAIKEMADIAEMAVKIRRFLNHIASSYSFFVYSLGVIGAIFVAEGLWEVFGGNESYWVISGILVGVVVATYLHADILSKVIIRISKSKRVASKTKYFYYILVGILIFFSIGGIAFLVAEYLPEAGNVSWYPALAIFLLLIYFIMRSEYTVPHLIASILMLVTSPLVLYTGSYNFAIGFLLISYLVAGLYGAYKGLEELGG